MLWEKQLICRDIFISFFKSVFQSSECLDSLFSFLFKLLNDINLLNLLNGFAYFEFLDTIFIAIVLCDQHVVVFNLQPE